MLLAGMSGYLEDLERLMRELGSLPIMLYCKYSLALSIMHFL